MALVDLDAIPAGTRKPQYFAWAKADMQAGLTWYQSSLKRKVAKSIMRRTYLLLGFKSDDTQMTKYQARKF